MVDTAMKQQPKVEACKKINTLFKHQVPIKTSNSSPSPSARHLSGEGGESKVWSAESLLVNELRSVSVQTTLTGPDLVELEGQASNTDLIAALEQVHTVQL